MWSLHITVCLAAGIIVNSGSDSGTHVARQTLTVSEAPFDSRLITFLPDQRVMLKHNNETRTLTLQDLVVWGSYTDHNSLPHVYLTDGGVLAADVVKITPAQVTLYSRIFTEVQIPRSLLRAIVFAPPRASYHGIISGNRFCQTPSTTTQHISQMETRCVVNTSQHPIHS